MKKLISILVSVVMLVSFMGISTFAAEEAVSVNSVYFEKHLSTGYVHRDFIQTGAYRAVVNLRNESASAENVMLMLAGYDNEAKLYSISCQNIEVASGCADYYTEDIAVTKNDLTQKLKVFVWGQGYEPILGEPVVLENADCEAKINSAIMSVTDGTNTLEWEGYVNEEENEITFYPDTLALVGRVGSETDAAFNALAAEKGVKSGQAVKANYKLVESFVDVFPTLLKTDATLIFDIENGTVINNPENDFSGKQGYNYTVVDNNGRFKTYTVRVMESAIIRQSDFNESFNIYNGIPDDAMANKNYIGTWNRIGFSSSDYTTSGFGVTRENNMLRVKQTIDNKELGLVTRLAWKGNGATVNRLVTSYDIQFTSLTGNGLYIGGSGSNATSTSTDYVNGRQALLYKPVTVDGENKVEIKYLRGLSTNYRHVAENSFATPIYLDYNTKYEIDVIYKQLKDTNGYPCYAELYINGEYKGSLGSGWMSSAMNLIEGNFVINSFASDTYKTTYDVYLDNIDINYIGNTSYYIKDAVLR